MNLHQECIDTLYMDLVGMAKGAASDAKENPTATNIAWADCLDEVVSMMDARQYELEAMLEARCG